MSGNTKKYLLVSHTADLNGAERSLLDLAVGLASRNQQVAVVCPCHGPLLSRLQHRGISTYILRMPRPRRLILHVAAFVLLWPVTVLRLSLLIRRLDVAVVYNNTIDALYAPFACLLVRKPCVWHIREVKPGWGPLRSVFSLVLRTVPNTTVFNSRATMQAFTTSLVRNWKVVYNGVEILPPTCRSRTAPHQEAVVGFIGQMVHHKRPDRFLRALAEACLSCPTLRGLVAGDGPLLDSLKVLARDLGLQDRVLFLGRVDAPARFYSEIDVLVLTSERESFGRVLVEAMSTGVPVVAARVEGVSEVVEEGIGGFLVGSDDISAYAARIVQIASSPDLQARLGVAARKRAVSQFSLDRYVQDLSEVFCAAERRERS